MQMLQNHQATIRNLGNHMGQLRNVLHTRPIRELPSDTQLLRVENGECKTTTLYNSKELPDPQP